MKRVVIQGDLIKSKSDFHEQVKVELSAPDYYGKNLDALLDILRDYEQLPVTIVWKDIESSKLYLGDYADKAMMVFKDAAAEIEGLEFELS